MSLRATYRGTFNKPDVRRLISDVEELYGLLRGRDYSSIACSAAAALSGLCRVASKEEHASARFWEKRTVMWQERAEDRRSTGIELVTAMMQTAEALRRLGQGRIAGRIIEAAVNEAAGPNIKGEDRAIAFSRIRKHYIGRASEALNSGRMKKAAMLLAEIGRLDELRDA